MADEAGKAVCEGRPAGWGGGQGSGGQGDGAGQVAGLVGWRAGSGGGQEGGGAGRVVRGGWIFGVKNVLE